MNRYLYANTMSEFIRQDINHILGTMTHYYGFSLEESQKHAWITQIQILKRELKKYLQSRIIFEYTIPRMAKRVDNIFLHNGIVFVLEFKVGEQHYPKYAIDQVMDYALDLKNFHKESHHRLIVPILIASKAPSHQNDFFIYSDGISKPILCNESNITSTIDYICQKHRGPFFSNLWEDSIYMPTPTIIEAAQAMYKGHRVQDISRSDAGAINLRETTQAVNQIIDFSKAEKAKSICFITGVPGAGKTLAGLNIACERHRNDQNEHAVFLSGNGPLVAVLQESLARDDCKQNLIPKSKAIQKAKSFIQNVHVFRDFYIHSQEAPFEKVTIFDEAQRAWTAEQTSKFMQTKKGIPDFSMSEPEFLISVMERHQDWAVIVCLIGEGQEINVGEAGLSAWFESLKSKYRNWNVFISSHLFNYEHLNVLKELRKHLTISLNNSLNLSVSLRSFRSEKVSEFVKELLDANLSKSKAIFSAIRDYYPVCITRNLQSAKNWITSIARGTERTGIIASSGAVRLKASGIWVQAKIDAINWFLNDITDVRSSSFLEDAATEFDVQGLEIDWAIVAWDANLRFEETNFRCYNFAGSSWQNINKAERLLYLKNSYRVLLTRARQGMVIFVPEGTDYDLTRRKSYYDGTYEFLKSIGIPVI